MYDFFTFPLIFKLSSGSFYYSQASVFCLCMCVHVSACVFSSDLLDNS